MSSYLRAQRSGTDLVQVYKAFPKSVHIISKVGLNYYPAKQWKYLLSFKAEEIGLYPDFKDVDVDVLNEIYFVVFIHLNIAYCIMFTQEKYVVLFNFTVYLQRYSLYYHNNPSNLRYKTVADYVHESYRVDPTCAFVLDFEATGNKLSDE